MASLRSVVRQFPERLMSVTLGRRCVFRYAQGAEELVECVTSLATFNQPLPDGRGSVAR